MTHSIFEWVEERVETLTPEEVVARNNILSADINTENATQEFNLWLESDGIRLTDFILEKRTTQQQLKEKDGENQLIIRDAAQRRELNVQNKQLIAEVKQLQSAKKQHGDRVEEKYLERWKKEKRNLRRILANSVAQFGHKLRKNALLSSALIILTTKEANTMERLY